MTRFFKRLPVFAALATLLLTLGVVSPASAHQTGPPTDCGFDHACSYRDAHYGVKIGSPSGLGSICHANFSQVPGLNAQLSSVYNHATGRDYWLFEHANVAGRAVGFGNYAFLAHLSDVNFNDVASSCLWVP